MGKGTGTARGSSQPESSTTFGGPAGVTPRRAARPISAARCSRARGSAGAYASTPVTSRAPSVEALGKIASTVVRETMQYGTLPLGLTSDDLVADGWVAWAEHVRRHPGASDGTLYARARFAMLDLIRVAMSPVSGPPGRIGQTVAAPLSELAARHSARASVASCDVPVRRFRLRRTDIQAFRAYCGRRLSPRSARLMIALCCEDCTLEQMAGQLGITRQQAAVARSQAITALLAGRST
jgi:hypothetical protein